MRWPLLITACLLFASCAQRHAAKGVTYLVGMECHPKATLTGCDDQSPPHCKKVVLKYDKGCEKVVSQ